jgi:hypothetical protein
MMNAKPIGLSSPQLGTLPGSAAAHVARAAAAAPPVEMVGLNLAAVPAFVGPGGGADKLPVPFGSLTAFRASAANNYPFGGAPK